jgi:intracellular sulfur oxidation DsrE/DsrF family protein
MEKSQIEVVANSEAVEFYRKELQTENTQTAERLFSAGVMFAACRNALDALGISEEELSPFVRTVPAGVLELALCQADGYSYIKP